MRLLIKYTLFFLLWTTQGVAAEPVVDTAYSLRSVPAEYLEEYRSDPYYRYTETKVPAGWWNRFVEWLARKLFTSTDRTTRDTLDFSLKLAIVVLVLGAFFLLIKSGVISPFGRKARKIGDVLPDSIDFSDEDTYPRLLAEALAKEDYPQAVRVRFLYLLKLLDEMEIIRLDLRKTNADYRAEINRKELKKGFGELAYYFECVSYGDFRVESEAYGHIGHCFDRFQEGLKK